MRLDSRGVLSAGIIWVVVTMLVAVSIGGLVFGKIQTQAKSMTESGSLEENIVTEVTETGSDVFPLLLLLVIVAVLGSIVAVLKVLL